MRNWLDRAANKIRRFAIPNLMKYIVISMGAVFVLDLVFMGRRTPSLVFSKSAMLSGQI